MGGALCRRGNPAGDSLPRRRVRLGLRAAPLGFLDGRALAPILLVADGPIDGRSGDGLSWRHAKLAVLNRRSPTAVGAAALAGLSVGACAAPTAQSRDYAWEDSTLNLMEQPEDRLLASAGQPQPAPREPSRRPRLAPRSSPPPTAAARPEPKEPVAQSEVAATPPPPTQATAAPSPGASTTSAPEQPAAPAEAAAAQLPAAPSAARPPQGDQTLRAVQRVEAAQTLLGTPGLQERAFVAHVLRAAGQDIAVDAKQPYAASLWRKLEAAGAKVAVADAKPGDLIFFRDTADLNGNGQPDDGVTLVGVVERLRGTHAVFIAQRAGKVRRMAVDAARPLVIRDGAGEVINTRLVRWPGSDTPWTTGQCLFGFGRPQ